jgi:hypothetical protein
MARAASTDTIAAVPKYEALNEVDMRLNEIEHMLIFACDVVEKLSGRASMRTRPTVLPSAFGTPFGELWS